MVRQINVNVRVCTLIAEYKEDTNDVFWKILESSDIVSESGSENVQSKDSNLDEVAKSGFFKTVAEPFIEKMTPGFNGSILVIEERYTGESSMMIGNTNDHGIIPLTFGSISKKVNELGALQFMLSASYIEITDEYVKDLLEDSDTDFKLCGKIDPYNVVQNLKKLQVYSSDIILDLITQGTRRRTYETSSHTIFSINLQKPGDTDVSNTTSRLNLIFLDGCVDLAGASGDQPEKDCPHFTEGKILNLLNGKQERIVSAQESLPNTVLKQFLEGSSIVCTISTGASLDFFSSPEFSSRSADVTNRLEQTAALSDTAGSAHQYSNTFTQDEPDTATKMESGDVYWQLSSSKDSSLKHISLLSTIEEEEEIEEDSLSEDNISINTSEKGERSLKEYEYELCVRENGKCENCTALPHNLTKRKDNCIHSHLQRCKDSSETKFYSETTSELLERVAYYQRRYDELREFTHIEKQIYEESCNMQLSDLNSRIQELQTKSENLEFLLKEAQDKCKDLFYDDLKGKPTAEKELVFLRKELIKSEAKRNDCEARLELIESNCRKRNRELTQYLDEAWSELSNYEEEYKNNLCNGYANKANRCEEQTVKVLSNEIADLKEEISFLRRENGRYAALSQKIQEFCKLKKCLLQESKLTVKIPDLEQEINILKNENTKLSENLNTKILELKEVKVTDSLLKEEKCLIEYEKAKLTKCLEDKFIEIESLNSQILKLQEEIEILYNDNIVLHEKIEEMGNVSSENFKLKEEINILNEKNGKLSKSLEDTVREVKETVLQNLSLREEINSLKNESVGLINTVDEKVKEIKKLTNENSIQWNKICSLKSNEHFLSNMREKLESLSSKLGVSEAKIVQLDKLDNENLKLKSDISSMKYEMYNVSKSSEAKNQEMKEMNSKYLILKEEVHSQANCINHLFSCVEEKNVNIQVLDCENEKLKEELFILKQTKLKISESLNKKDSETQKLLNENFILKEKMYSLKNINDKVSKEMVETVNELDQGNNLLREKINRLENEIKDKVVEIIQFSTKMEEKKLETANLRTEVSVLKKEYALLQEDNINLSRALNQYIQDLGKCEDQIQPLITTDTKPEVFMEVNNNLQKDNVVINQKEEWNKLMFGAEKLSLNEISSSKSMQESPCSNLILEFALQEEQKASSLQRKVGRQRRMLNMIQKRELQMRTNLEMCKNQMESLQNLELDNAMQNYRIFRLELQAQHDNYVHENRASCLEKIVGALRKKNLVLQSQLHLVHSQMKTTQHCNQSVCKQAAVQTSLPMNDSCPNSLHVAGFNSDVKECGLPKIHAKPNTEDHNISSFSSHLHKSWTSNAQIQRRRNKAHRMQKKLYSRNIEDKNLPNHSKQTSFFINNQSQNTEHDTVHLGAEGWTRLSREFDLQYK